jgi:hypothetical protein
MTGARARLTIDGKKVGWATGIRCRRAIDYREALVLDDIMVAEHVPTVYRVSLSFTTLTMIGKSLEALGLFPKGGNAAGDRLRNILDAAEMTVIVEDNSTGDVLFQVLGVKLSEINLGFDAGNISGTDVTAVARELKDGSEL